MTPHATDVGPPDVGKRCSACVRIPAALFSGEDPFLKHPYHPNYLALQASADAGCPVCRFFQPHAAILIEDPSFPRHLRAEHLEADGLKPIVLASFHKHGQENEVNIMYGDRNASLDKVRWDFAHTCEVPRNPLTTNDADRIYELGRCWIKTCHEQHVGCRDLAAVTLEESRLPARLIDIGPTKDGLKLCSTEGQAEESMPYIALSHCWGNLEKTCVTTKRANLNQRFGRLPFDELSQNFQDATKVTRKLGVRYLRIDALCIVQDDERDWQKECTVMATVYARAVCTLAAGSAADSSVGLFTRVNALGADPIRLDFSTPAHPSVVLHPRPIAFDDARAGRKTLTTRGWCLQEDVLSPRTLFFTDRGVSWRCHGGDVLDTSGIPNSALEGPASLNYKGNEKYYEQWRNCVEDFTSRKLTRRTDQLPAVSALAKAVVLQEDRNPKDTYLAGLWRGDLLSGLFWKKDPGSTTLLQRPRLDNPPTYLAPSWSWASVVEPVRFELGGLEKRQAPTILSASCEPAGLDPLGQVAGGFIIIEGAVVEVHAAATPASEDLEPPLSLLTIRFPHSGRERAEALERMGTRYAIFNRNDDQNSLPIGQFYYDDERDREKTDRLYCLRMTSIDVSAEVFDRSYGRPLYADELPVRPMRCERVMMLARVDSAKMEFRRVGVGEIRGLVWFDSVPQTKITIL